MAKIIPIVVFLLKFVMITTQWNYDVQRSNEDLYDLRRLLDELGIGSNGQENVLHIIPKHYVDKHKHTDSDTETQKFNQQALNALFKNDNSEPISMENDKQCKTGRCGCGKGGLRCKDNRDDNDDSIVYKDGVEQLLNELKREIEKHGRNKSKNKLRCNSINRRCGRGRTGNDNIRSNSIKRETLIEKLKHHGKKYKVNDDVDAIVIDLSHLDELLGNSNNFCLDGTCNEDIINLDLNEDGKLDKGVKKLPYNIEAEINDVTGEQIEDTFMKQVKNLLINKPEKESILNPEDLFTYYQLYKNLIIDKITDYVKSKDGRKTGIQNVTEKQKRLIDNVKQIQNSGLAISDREIKKQIARIIFGKHSLSKVIPHNESNNNIYIPEWFYRKAAKSKNGSNVRAHKRLLPLTLQQRQRKAKKAKRVWRRDSETSPNVENYGVPFELEVQGLGQVIP